ncbi:MAG: ATP-dependent helicase [Deltaproteobacteria bacterium]|jgi:DNA helicase-2/ATP-dependent DNA helicase PcrA|nr:ATP-dependent helicase [Deltaproteobacteria bacterium]
MIESRQFNENQQKAIDWNDEPLLVIAGPGSGKTAVITARIVRILEESKGEYFRILGLTFTNKAAAEMRTRVHELAPSEINRLRLTTYHSFAAEFLRQNGSHIGLKPDFEILPNDADRLALIEESIKIARKESSYEIPDYFDSKCLLPIISFLLGFCITPDDAEEKLKNSNINFYKSIALIYKNYWERLTNVNALDFQSLIAKAIFLFKKVPFLAKKLRIAYRHLLVDEFQDTNYAQYEFLRCLATPNTKSLFVVGDDDQTIYEWNGANNKRFQSLRSDFNMKEIQLTQNYRCPRLVIEMANSLISNNHERYIGKKPLIAIKEGNNFQQNVKIFRFNDIKDELRWVAKDISTIPENELGNCVVLSRTNRLLKLIKDELDSNNVKSYLLSNKHEFSSHPLRMLFSILNLMIAKDNIKALNILSSSFFSIENIEVDLDLVITRASGNGSNLLAIWIEEILLKNELSDNSRVFFIEGIKPLFNSLNYKDFSNSLFSWYTNNEHNNAQLHHNMFDLFLEEKEIWIGLYNEISNKFIEGEIGLHQFLQEVNLSSKAPRKHPNAVSCFTIHSSKGLEFKYVYLIGMIENQLPSFNAVKKGDNSREMEEERRSCFVALTRTVNNLTMTFSNRAFDRSQSPSRFLTEMNITL